MEPNYFRGYNDNYTYWRTTPARRDRLAQDEYVIVNMNHPDVRNASKWVWCTGDIMGISELNEDQCSRIIKHIEAGRRCAEQEHKLYSVMKRKETLIKKSVDKQKKV